jgi:hypothetical protein|tara:strand:- start:1322 stop:1534 length:213 start_codon:yes stop_codon:yes gene_type:complete
MGSRFKLIAGRSIAQSWSHRVWLGTGREGVNLEAAVDRSMKAPLPMKVEFIVMLLMQLAVLGVALAWLMP